MTHDKLFGPVGDEPRSYWRPWLGDWFSLRPVDMAGMTPGQLMACYRHTQKDDS